MLALSPITQTLWCESDKIVLHNIYKKILKALSYTLIYKGVPYEMELVLCSGMYQQTPLSLQHASADDQQLISR